ncbi:MAG TPA: hypothetical protein VK132_03265 [Gemmatimonadales bacterium]|nr:hypothetical protein [Gemmatimonadales bacterium]
MVAGISEPTGPTASLSTVVIVGGGCYGTFYAGQLELARARGAATYRRLLVVDRDPDCRIATDLPPDPDRELVVSEWGAFFDRFLSEPPSASGPPDAIVPSPLMPHLMYEWLLRGARARWPGRSVESRPLDVPIGTPYETVAPGGTRYVSFADWLCPVHCVEPAVCPVIRGPRTWEMGDAVGTATARLAASRRVAGPVLFVCRHRVYGVGMFDVASVLDGRRIVLEAGALGEPVDVVVGTVSSCHGAVSVLHLGPAAGEPGRV